MSDELAIIEQVLIGGDLAKLSTPARVEYYNRVCDSLALNPLTKPFQYLQLNGKLILYATKDCTEQLRKRDSISISIVGRELVEGVYVVTARASNPAGRSDESIGAVSLENLKGEARANALMKAETKAKRRVTLSFAGLGMLDESEVSSIPGAVAVPMDATVRTVTSDHPDADGAIFTIENEPRQPREADKLSACNTCGATIAWAHINGRSLPYEVVDGVRQDARHKCSGPAPAEEGGAKVYTPAQREKMIGKIRQQMRDLDPVFTTEERTAALTRDLDEMSTGDLVDLGIHYANLINVPPF